MDKDKSAAGKEQDASIQEAIAEARRRREEGGARLAAKKSKRRRRRAVYSGIAAALLLVLLGTGASRVYAALNSMISGEETEAGVLPEEVKSSEEEIQLGIVNFLVCGIDYSDDDEDSEPDSYNPNAYSANGDAIGNTDMILYVRYDTYKNDLRILQLPRDIYVGDEYDTGGYGKINSLYKYADDTDNRMAALVQVIYDQLHLPVDFYITIDMDAVKEIIDITGGVEVFVPVDVDNPETGDIIYSGWRYFDGDAAEYFLRNRYSSTYGGQGDIMRLQMQQYFYAALFREFKALTPGDLVMWLGILMYRAKTDMDVLKIGTIAQNALSLQGADITFVRPSTGGATHNGHFVSTLIPEEMADLLNEYFRGDGEQYSAEELNIHTVEVDETFGVAEAMVRTMDDIVQEQAEYDAQQAEQESQDEGEKNDE